jgi:hypothetical protein
MENLIVLTKFKEEPQVEPTEMARLCLNHYNPIKYENYKVNKVESTIPHFWCDVCNPSELN